VESNEPTEIRKSRVIAGALLLVCVPAVIVGDALRACLLGWRPESTIHNMVIVAGVVLTLIVVAILLSRKGRQFLARRAPDFLVLVLSICISWFGIEFFFGSVGHRYAVGYHCRPPLLEALYEPSPEVMPGITGKSRFSTNSYGIRGLEFPARKEAYRILCIGGSTTECIYLDDEETWTARLPEEINGALDLPQVWSGGVGMSGNATYHHLKFLRESPIIDKVDHVVMFIGMNDLVWAIDGSEGMRVEESRSYHVRPWWTRSNVLRLMESYEAIRQRNLQKEANAFMARIMTEDFLGKYYVARRRFRQSSTIVDTAPDLTSALEDYAARIAEVVEACDDHGMGVLFVTQPVLWRADLPEELRDLLWLGRVAKGRFLNAAELRRGIDACNRVLLETCERLGVPCVDLSHMNGNSTYFYDDCHLNEAGAEEVGHKVADWFIEDVTWR
jgi:lysophospholipase L1-like esterase